MFDLAKDQTTVGERAILRKLRVWIVALAVACLVTIYSMRAFDMIFALTQGGPLDSSNVLPLLSYQFSFQQFKFGIGAAVGTFAVVFVFAVALVYVRTLKHEARA